MYGRDRRLATLLLGAFAAEQDLVVGDNQPYNITDAGDYGIPVYGERAGRPAAMIEIRQDLIEAPEEAARWAERLARAWGRVQAALP